MNCPPACSAQATLASSLLSSERSRSDHQHHWQTGIPSLDRSLPLNTWTGGKVIGIVDDSDVISLGPSDAQPVSLATQLIVTHLASVTHQDSNSNTSASLPVPAAAAASSPFPSSSSSSSTSVYIIASLSSPSAESSAVSPSTLATRLAEASLPPHPLDRVSLLQYLDFAGLA